MVPIDPRIALGVQPLQLPQQDPNQGLNSLARIMQIKSAQQEGDMNAIKMQELQRGVTENNTLNDVYRNALAPDGTVDRTRLFSTLAEKNLGSRIPDLQKKFLDTDKSQAELAKTQAETKKFQLEYGIKQAEHAASLFSLAKDQGSYDMVRQYLSRAHGPESVAAMPHQFDPTFVQTQVSAGLTIAQKLEDERKRQEQALRQVNEPFTAGPNGQPVPNQPVQNFQLSKAKAGATNVSVNTEKSYAGNMAEGLAKQDLSLLDAARTAPERIANAQRVKQILDTQPTITGSGAETRLALSKALSTAGLIDGQAVKSTEDLASLLASSTLDAIKTSGLGSGQGFTDKDRAFLERAKSGNIEINGGTIRTLADLNEKAARASIDAGARVAGRLKGNPTMGSVGQDFNFAQPPEYKGPSVVRKPPAAAGSAPKGVRFLGFEEQK